MPLYHHPLGVSLRLLLAVLLGRRQSFQRDSRELLRGVSSLRILGDLPPLESAKGWLVVVNHYSRPGFRAWWIPISIASVFPVEMHWVMTSTLTYRDWRSRVITPASEWLLPRIARTVSRKSFADSDFSGSHGS